MAHNAHDIATSLVEEDVERGDYEGCSTELEIAYSDYFAQAERFLQNKVLPA